MILRLLQTHDFRFSIVPALTIKRQLLIHLHTHTHTHTHTHSRPRLYRPPLEWTLIIMDLLQSPAFFLCFITATTSVTPVPHISYLRLRLISPPFPNSLFSSAIPFLAK
jgi:hypothetical protein